MIIKEKKFKLPKTVLVFFIVSLALTCVALAEETDEKRGSAKVLPGFVSFGTSARVVSSMDAPDTSVRGLAFDGNNLWVAGDSEDRIYKLDSSGAVIHSFETNSVWTDGLTFDGTDLLCSSSYNDKINRFNTAGDLMGAFDSPGQRPDGLAYEGGNIWHADYSEDRIYKLGAGGEVLGSFASPGGNPNGLAFDGDYLWNSDSETGAIYKMDAEGYVLYAFKAPGANPNGLAHDGTHLWNGDSSEDKIYKIEVKDTPVKAGESQNGFVVVKNVGEGDLVIDSITVYGKDEADFALRDNWSQRVLKSGESVTVDVVFCPTSGGPKRADLLVKSDDPAGAVITVPLSGLGEGGVLENGFTVDPDLWIRGVIHTEEKGPIEAVWRRGGEDTTDAGDRVIWGFLYASPEQVNWGSRQNPDVFVKIWFDRSGRLDVNFFHVSVPDVDVYSDYLSDSKGVMKGTATMSRRYIRQYYMDGDGKMDESYEDGLPPEDDSPSGNPQGYETINDLVIGAIIHTEEKGAIDARWRMGGAALTEGGHQVLWGHFYADKSDVNWGSSSNPDLYVKVWFDAGGRVDVNYFHVSVPKIEAYSALPGGEGYNRKGTTTMDNRYVRHEYYRSVAREDGIRTVRSNTPRDVDVKVDAWEMESLSSGNNTFALDIFREIYQENQNLVFSPYSLSSALAMTWAGAREETQNEMAGVLHFNLPEERLHKAFNALSLSLSGPEDDGDAPPEFGSLNMVNSIWAREGQTFLPSFVDVLAGNYGAGVKLLDFKNDPEGSREAINDWVAMSTHNTVETLIPRGGISSATSLVITDAIFFNEIWKSPFEKEGAIQSVFHLSKEEDVSVTMMRQKMFFNYLDGEGHKALEMPYESGEFSFTVVMPDMGRFGEFAHGFSAGEISNITEGMEPVYLDLMIPRFSFESEAFSLSGVLSEMGMPLAFNGNADFSGMDGTGNLFISEVLHKAFISVDESGTLAGAATGVVGGPTSVPNPPEPIHLAINAPFLFYIRHVKTDTILFLGAMVSPESEEEN